MKVYPFDPRRSNKSRLPLADWILRKLPFVVIWPGGLVMLAMFGAQRQHCYIRWSFHIWHRDKRVRQIKRVYGL